MLKRFRLPLLTATVLLLLASCNKTNKQGKLIPKDAMLVIHVSGESLNSKLPWDDIKKNQMFQEMYADSTLPPFIKSLLDNPENSGVDVNNDLIGFACKDSIGGYFAIEGTIKDAAKFSTFNTFITKGGTNVEKEGMNFISKSPMCVGWSKEKFVYVVDMPQLGSMGSFMGRNVGEDSKPRDVGATCSAVFAIKEENSLAKDEKFSSLMNDKGDMHFWVNTNALMSGNDMMGMLSMTKISDLYKDALSTASLTFNNGKIDVDFKSYSSKAMTDLMKKYEGGEINTDMFKRYGSKDIVAAFALNFKPEVIREILKVTGMDGMANNYLRKAGISLDDFVKGNKGDIFIAASDIKPESDTVRYGTGPTDYSVKDKPNGKFIFAASINDRPSFNNLIKAEQNATGGPVADSIAKAKGISYNTNDKYFAIGNDKALVDQYMAGGNNDFPFLKNISGNPIGGYLNIQGIMKSMSPLATKDSTSTQMFNASMQLWEDAYIKGGKYSDGAMTQHFEINLVDKNTNSLKQLNTYFAKLTQLVKARQKKYVNEFSTQVDSTTNITVDSVISNSRH